MSPSIGNQSVTIAKNLALETRIQSSRLHANTFEFRACGTHREVRVACGQVGEGAMPGDIRLAAVTARMLDEYLTGWPGGRNWLPFTTLAMMLGFDMVRVGMEDSVYVYPHRNEKLATSVQAVRKVVAIANELGREIATPDEARQIMGIKLGSRGGAKAAARSG